MTLLAGDPNVESTGNSIPQGKVRAFKCPGLESQANASSFELYVCSATNAASTIKVGVYEDNSGVPGNRLHQATISSPTGDDWNAGILSQVVNTGTVYWLAVLGTNGQAGILTKFDGSAEWVQ